MYAGRMHQKVDANGRIVVMRAPWSASSHGSQSDGGASPSHGDRSGGHRGSHGQAQGAALQRDSSTLSSSPPKAVAQSGSTRSRASVPQGGGGAGSVTAPLGATRSHQPVATTAGGAGGRLHVRT